MNIDDKFDSFIKDVEGVVLHVYKDAAGLPTLGIGHLLTKSELASGKIMIHGIGVEYANGITMAQALSLLGQDAQPAAHTVDCNVKVPLNQNQFNCLTSFVFNVGIGAFMDSTLLRLLNQGQYDAVPDQLMRWTNAGGQHCEGLVERRKKEIQLWKGLL